MYKEISLERFKSEVESVSNLWVDLNSLLQVCGASPLHVHYKTDKVTVITTFPAQIELISGNSAVSVSQIQKIIRTVSEDGKVTYEIVCGRLKPLETTIKITQI